MSEKVIEPKSKAFALRVVKMYRWLKGRGETVMAMQVLRSGTSIGANVAEAQYAQSKADFVTKMTIALKEASETRYWLELLLESKYLPSDSSTQSLLSDCTEIIRLLVATTKTARNR